MATLTILRDWPVWVLVLGWGFTILSFVVVPIAMMRAFPQNKMAKEFSVFQILKLLVPFMLGIILFLLLRGPIAHEKELAGGILTASSIVLALSGVLLGIARFSAVKKTPEEILAGTFKLVLIFSVIAGLITIFLSLFWYAKGTSGFLEWAAVAFGTQLGYVLIFLFFPKYYLR